ncbi:HNH endonuclease [Microbacterium sp. No. 7]|uniref:HNH endonuclease n=1 Tax=Microbacterium sp. No. 7 TaxID=1714373 RepID=UPI0006D19380|nr:HNH endonuclease signature motif containing protein [Microbacterium sp. No. 7]ALJ20951.1 hypothetical protein AOA12_14015 [Microbacterium sp. No. 7]
MNPDALAGIAEALDVLRAAGGGRPVEALTPGELVAVNAAFGALRRHVDAALVPVAGEIARQSRPVLGKESLARRQGFRSAEQLIGTAWGIAVGEARRFTQVGEATAPRTALSGEALPERHPHLADAVRAGLLGVTAAAAIVTMLDRVAPRAGADALRQMEQHLAIAAAELRPDELGKLLAHAEALLDPDGLEPRLDAARADRSLSVTERDGVLRLVFTSDVVSGAPVRAAVEGIVTATLNSNRNRERAADAAAGEPAGGTCDDRATGNAAEAEADQRSMRQLRADALIELCDHALGCEQTPTRPTVSVVVRMTLEQLQTGTGAATIDGTDQPIDAGAVRRLAADLQIIPAVLGGESEILDLGRATRLFTRAQKHAITERDGGCVGCGAPPGRCHVHHLTWWSHGGRTDLSNGVLLCAGCHHRLHDDGWDIRIDGPGTKAKVWMIPPAWIDPARTPRLAGRHRYALAT